MFELGGQQHLERNREKFSRAYFRKDLAKSYQSPEKGKNLDYPLTILERIGNEGRMNRHKSFPRYGFLFCLLF